MAARSARASGDRIRGTPHLGKGGRTPPVLRSFGIAVECNIAKTGIVGSLRRARPGGRAIAFRADMDALPIEERNHFAHASQHQGRMHAWGHDGHTAMLLGGAR